MQKTSPQFSNLKKAIFEERWSDIPNYLTVAKSLKEWSKGEFVIDDGGGRMLVTYKGEALPRDLNNRIIEMATKGEDPAPFFNFFEKLQKNPSYRSVNQLWGFLAKEGIPLTPDGCFLAYKSVTDEYKDHHTGKVNNTPGTINEMPRNKISDDPKTPCHEGFHVGSERYARTTWSGDARIVVCKVDPQDVVCVPYDHSQEKMRVCKYEVMGNSNGQVMSSTVHVDASDSVDTDEQVDEEKDPPNYNPAMDPLSDENMGIGGDSDDEDEDDDEESAPKAKPEKKAKAKPEVKQKAHTKFDKLDMTGLMNLSIDELRQYAGKNLMIVGASKIPGGKTALVGQILKVRK